MDVVRKVSLPLAGWRKICWTTSLMTPVSTNIQAGGLRLGFFLQFRNLILFFDTKNSAKA